MENTVTANPVERRFVETPERTDEHSSGVSWGAVIGGAFVAAAIALIMLALGAGFGLSAVSPWSNAGASATTIGVGVIVWLIVMQVVAYSLGGYLAGRLRTRWVAVHSDEVHFRDTANGFLAWAVGVVITVTFLASAATSMVGSSAQAADKALSDSNSYFVDRLFRAETPGGQPLDPGVQAEAGRILSSSVHRTDSNSGDQAYLAKLVAAKTGLSQADAQKRVSDVMTEVQQAADTARRSAARLLLWIFVALLAGAFCASYAATIGGRQRDHMKAI
jgi:hypothetical protein